MADLVTKIVDCVRVRDQTVVACYRLSHELTLGPSSQPPREQFIRAAQEKLAAQGLANPPFEGIEFVSRRLAHAHGDRCGNAVESDGQTDFLTARIWTTSLRRVWSCCSLSSVETAMTYENCKLEAVQQQNGGWGFVVSNEYSRPLFSLTYATKAAAEEAHGLMAKVITGAEVTPHP
jgi:hypothetical protein